MQNRIGWQKAKLKTFHSYFSKKYTYIVWMIILYLEQPSKSNDKPKWHNWDQINEFDRKLDK